ncbi:alkaline phosphatase, tissue-nonspecific isozyme-like, partial [Physella acuta]|uniref:alkaline phosphatase, tissue-nonspecific isozyme-like n=1 Tax=Physella acuta TaxID=109671 RepID=UPI0027DCA6A7
QEEWLHQGRAELRRAIMVSRRHNKNLAKNVILFIGDGMGISTVTASRIRGGQLRGEKGEENLLYFERFPHVGLIKTYSADSQVTGSAAAGSAILTGVKINSGVVGCDSRVKKGNCTTFTDKTRLKTIVHAFVDEGLSTGIVTNSRITHATPASAYAQTPHRGWEGDVDMSSGADTADCRHVDDIAKQLVRNNSNIKVLLGGGRRYFLDNETADPVTGKIDQYQRRDGLNLIEEWKQDKILRNESHSYVWNREQLNSVDAKTTNYLLGLFNPSHMDYDVTTTSQSESRQEPNLVEMTEKAIQILQNDKNGYFLLVEGARIDFGHHANSAITAITETLELDEAVKAAVRMTDSQDTLIMVTADHSHAFAIQGYAPRGNDILGTADPGVDSYPLDGLPYTTLGYTNGPIFNRADLSNVDTGSFNFRQQGCIPVSVETHAGEDVSVYGMGPMAHLLHATHEQNYLYHVMEYAACVGRSKKYCKSKSHRRGESSQPSPTRGNKEERRGGQQKRQQ